MQADAPFSAGLKLPPLEGHQTGLHTALGCSARRLQTSSGQKHLQYLMSSKKYQEKEQQQEQGLSFLPALLLFPARSSLPASATWSISAQLRSSFKPRERSCLVLGLQSWGAPSWQRAEQRHLPSSGYIGLNGILPISEQDLSLSPWRAVVWEQAKKGQKLPRETCPQLPQLCPTSTPTGSHHWTGPCTQRAAGAERDPGQP